MFPTPLMILLCLSLLSFVLSLATVFLLKARFRTILLDIPNHRSSHTQPTPRGGGIGFIIAFFSSGAIALILSFCLQRPEFLLGITPQQGFWLGLSLMPLTIIGVIDDQKGVKVSIRFLVQIITATVAVIVFQPFPQPWLMAWGDLGSILAFLLTVLGFTAFINFYNFMDGLDGLVAGVSIIQMSFFALYCHEPFLWLFVAALLGFLVWNWSPAKIFMGDAGSTVIGAMSAIALLLPDLSPVQSGSALAVILPLVGDAIYTLSQRLRRGENILQAHRSHIYQRLQQQGWSHSQVALMYLTLTLFSAISLHVWGLFGAGLTILGVVSAIALAERQLTQSPLSQHSQESK